MKLFGPLTAPREVGRIGLVGGFAPYPPTPPRQYSEARARVRADWSQKRPRAGAGPLGFVFSSAHWWFRPSFANFFLHFSFSFLLEVPMEYFFQIYSNGTICSSGIFFRSNGKIGSNFFPNTTIPIIGELGSFFDQSDGSATREISRWWIGPTTTRGAACV
jgi:hypothetical protein